MPLNSFITVSSFNIIVTDIAGNYDEIWYVLKTILLIIFGNIYFQAGGRMRWACLFNKMSLSWTDCMAVHIALILILPLLCINPSKIVLWQVTKWTLSDALTDWLFVSSKLQEIYICKSKINMIFMYFKYCHFQLCVGTTVNDTLEGVIMIHLFNKRESYTDTLLIWILWKFDMKHAEQHWLSGPFRKGFPFLAISDDVLQCIWCAQQSLNIFRLWLSGNPKGKRWT